MKTIRYILAMLAVLSAFAMAATSSAAGAPSLPNLFDFNNALKPWTAGASDHGCLDKESLLLREEIGMIPGLPNRYAALTSNCGGRVWMMAAIDASGDTVEITFDARDLSGCEGCIPLVYAGRAQPKGVYQFTTNYQMLNADWQTHKFRIDLKQGIEPLKPGPDRLYVAIAFANLDSERPEVKHSTGIDNVSITTGVPGTR